MKSPWIELDREFVAFQASQTAALGCSERDYWYGGKVHFTAKLKGELEGNKRRLFLELERLALGPSTRCSRRWGSASLLRVIVNVKSISKELYKGKPKRVAEQAIAEFFSRPFVLMGRVYRAYFAKENTTFLIATNERVKSGKDGVEVFNSSDGMNTSLEGFLDWFNPLPHNKEQVCASMDSISLNNDSNMYTTDDGQVECSLCAGFIEFGSRSHAETG